MPEGGLPLPFRAPGAIPQGQPVLDPSDPINTGLIGAWLFGGAAFDVSGNGNTGTLHGSPSPAWAPSPWGLALSFSGSSTSQYVDAGALSSISGATHCTIHAFFYRAAASNLVALGKGTSHTSCINITIYNDGNIYLEPTSAASSYGYFPSSATGYHSVAFVYDGTQSTNATRLQGFFDGIEQTLSFSGTVPSTLASPTGDFTIGKNSDALDPTWTTGIIGPVRVWLRTLPPPEIARLEVDPFAGLLFPSDRLWLWGSASGALTVAGTAALPGEFLATAAGTAALPQEAAASVALSAGVAAEFPSTVTRGPMLPADWTTGRLCAAPMPAEWLRAADGVAATPAEALAALAAGAVVAIENAGALSLVVAASATLPLEWQQLAVPVPLARLLTSPGRLRILSPAARRRLLASAGRLRTLKPTDR